MPEFIIRSYLVDPFLYSSDQTFCVTCEEHVPNSECYWAETRENVQTYFNRLRSKQMDKAPAFYETPIEKILPDLNLKTQGCLLPIVLLISLGGGVVLGSAAVYMGLASHSILY